MAMTRITGETLTRRRLASPRTPSTSLAERCPGALASPTNRSAQVTVISNDDPAAPGISVEVVDVDAVHARAVEQGFEIAYSLRDEEWGVRRFMLREPSGTLVNVVSHRSD